MQSLFSDRCEEEEKEAAYKFRPALRQAQGRARIRQGEYRERVLAVKTERLEDAGEDRYQRQR